MKLIKVADLRDVLDAYNREEISYSKMVEVLNNKANERLVAINYSQCCETLKDKKLKDLVNLAKSELSNENKMKVMKIQTEQDKRYIKLLKKIVDLQNL